MNAKTPRTPGKYRQEKISRDQQRGQGKAISPFPALFCFFVFSWRFFLGVLGVLGVLAFTSSVAANTAPLPEGNAPPALSFPHFPDRQHAFVWRNWGLVEPGRLA